MQGPASGNIIEEHHCQKLDPCNYLEVLQGQQKKIRVFLAADERAPLQSLLNSLRMLINRAKGCSQGILLRHAVFHRQCGQKLKIPARCMHNFQKNE